MARNLKFHIRGAQRSMENNDFDIPHDALARAKQLAEHQALTQFKKAVKRGMAVYEERACLGPYASRLISLMNLVNVRNE